MYDRILKASLERETVITIIYLKEDIITKRNILVLEVMNDSIKAYCFLRNSIRVFKKDSILAADYLYSKK